MFWCRDANVQSASECLLAHFRRFGWPNMIRSDRGSHFANNLMKEFLDLTGTPHNLTLAYSSQVNTFVERVNKEVNRHLRGLVFNTLSLVHYAKCTPFVQRIINNSINRRTNASPASILFADKLDMNRGILTSHLSPTLTSSNSTYITDLIEYRTRSSMQQLFLFKDVMINKKSPHRV